jgi:hypothetical protein
LPGQEGAVAYAIDGRRVGSADAVTAPGVRAVSGGAANRLMVTGLTDAAMR